MKTTFVRFDKEQDIRIPNTKNKRQTFSFYKNTAAPIKYDMRFSQQFQGCIQSLKSLVVDSKRLTHQVE